MQEELYRRFSPKMYAVCLRYAGNAEEAEDILQEGFIKVFKKLNSFRSEGSFEGWVRRIFVNTAIEHFRRKRYLMPVTEKEENTIEGKYLSVLDDLAARDIMMLVQELPSNLYGAEVLPPVSAWNKIATSLDADHEAAIPERRKISPLIKYAAAAVIIGLLAWSGIQVLNNRSGNKEVVKQEMLQP